MTAVFLGFDIRQNQFKLHNIDIKTHLNKKKSLDVKSVT